MHVNITNLSDLYSFGYLVILNHLNDLQMDTKDILFICGGAFVDLEKTISER